MNNSTQLNSEKKLNSPFRPNSNYEWVFGYCDDDDIIVLCPYCCHQSVAKFIEGRNSYNRYHNFCYNCGKDMRIKQEIKI